MDSVSSYISVWGKPKPLTKKQINQMKQIMRRVPKIKQKNDEYHKKEKYEADLLLSQKLDTIN